MGLLHLQRALMILCLSMALTGSAAPADDLVRAREEHTSLTARQTTIQCVNESGNFISEINTATCVRLLQIHGDEVCGVSGTDVVMFTQIDDAAIYGINALGTGTVEASCDDVATAAQSIINQCTDPNTELLQGRARVTGTPNLIVMIDSSHTSVTPCTICV